VSATTALKAQRYLMGIFGIVVVLALARGVEVYCR
jgi:hypothetical protein